MPQSNPLNYRNSRSSGSSATSAKPKNCRKGYSCKAACIAKTRQCLSPLTGQFRTYGDFLQNALDTGVALSPFHQADVQAQGLTPTPPPAPPTPVAPPNPIKTNQVELDQKRNDLINRFGQQQVEAAEQNVQKILNDDDVQIYVRIGATETIEKILGDQFRTALELGTTANVPHLQEPYADARRRVEEKSMGYGRQDPDSDRPIYGYFAGSDLSGRAHRDPADNWGSITVKLKPQAKERATFTGADSFKSGIASEAKTTGNPPPPNAASIVSTTRHGYDRADLPAGYPSYMRDNSGDGRQLTAAASAQSIDDLAPALASTGNAYVEAHVHGGVKPEDIEEIRFQSKGGPEDKPSREALRLAQQHGITVYFGDKKLSPQELNDYINPQSRMQAAMQALETGDYNTLLDYSDAIMNRVGYNSSRYRDDVLAVLYEESGYDALPRIGTSADITNAWKNDGATLGCRGIEDKPTITKEEMFDQFKTGTYFPSSNNMYGNGTYLSVAAGNATSDAVSAFDQIASRGYSGPNKLTMRLAIDADAKIVKGTDLQREISSFKRDFDNWQLQERMRLMQVH
ncbi:MAG TPA: hypothetical protein V6C95_06260, partial [Coleofasciculaceae cyanobacterium]